MVKFVDKLILCDGYIVILGKPTVCRVTKKKIFIQRLVKYLIVFYINLKSEIMSFQGHLI